MTYLPGQCGYLLFCLCCLIAFSHVSASTTGDRTTPTQSRPIAEEEAPSASEEASTSYGASKTTSIPPSQISNVILPPAWWETIKDWTRKEPTTKQKREYQDLVSVILKGKKRTDFQTEQQLDHLLYELAQFETAQGEIRRSPVIYKDAASRQRSASPVGYDEVVCDSVETSRTLSPSPEPCAHQWQGTPDNSRSSSPERRPPVSIVKAPERILASEEGLAATHALCQHLERTAQLSEKKKEKEKVEVDIDGVLPRRYALWTTEASMTFKGLWYQMVSLWRLYVPAIEGAPPTQDNEILRAFIDDPNGPSYQWRELFEKSIFPHLRKEKAAVKEAATHLDDLMYLLHHYELILRHIPSKLMTETVVANLRKNIKKVMEDFCQKAFRVIYKQLERDISMQIMSYLMGKDFDEDKMAAYGHVFTPFTNVYPTLDAAMITLKKSFIFEPVINGQVCIPWQMLIMHHFPLLSELAGFARWLTLAVKTYQAYSDTYDSLFELPTEALKCKKSHKTSCVHKKEEAEMAKDEDGDVKMKHYEAFNGDTISVVDDTTSPVTHVYTNRVIELIKDDVKAFRLDQQEAKLPLIPDNFYEFDEWYNKFLGIK